MTLLQFKSSNWNQHIGLVKTITLKHHFTNL
eukprot:UN16938